MQYGILGNDMQAVKVTLNPGEKIYSDSGKLISKRGNVVMTPRLVGGILKAVERKATGATGMLTEFEAQNDVGYVSFGGVLPGKIFVVKLGQGEEFIAEHDAFLAAESSVNGGVGVFLAKFEGKGKVIAHTVSRLKLASDIYTEGLAQMPQNKR